MASIKDSTGQDLSGYSPVAPTATPAPASAPAVQEAPARNPFLRTPLPSLNPTSPDSLRQWFNGGAVPQNRMLPLPSLPVNAGNLTTNESIFIAGGGSGGSTTPATSGQPVLFTNQQIVVTPQLSPGQKYVGSTQISNTFQLLGIFSGTAVRVQLYGSAVAQQADLARPLDVSPPAGTVQGLITDIALDTVPYLWNFENSIAANSEEPQTGTIYVTITNIGLTTSIVTATILFVALSLGLSPNAPALSVTPGGVISNLQLANSSQFAFLNTSNQFSGTISAPVVSVNSAAGLQIGNVQIQSADLSDSTNLSYLDQSNTFTGTIEAPVISAGSSAGLQIAGNQVTSLDLADSANIAYLNVSNTFTGDILAPVVSVNNAAGLQIAGTQVSSSALSDSSNLAYLNVSNTFTGPINAPVVDVATSAGLTVAGTQLSSINLLDSGNLALLNGVNVFTNTVTAPTLNITGSAANVFTGPVTAATITSTGSAASVFTGPVTAATFTQAPGSTTAVTFNGTVNAATFSGAVSTVNLTCTGGTVNFTGSGLTVTEINTFAPPTESNADKTLNHISSVYQNGPASTVSGTTNLTLITFSVTAVSTSDVFNLSANVMASFGAGDVAAITCKADGTTLFSGYGQFVSQSSTLLQVGQYIGTCTGLAAGTHTISLIISCGATITINAGEACAVLQQISS